MSLIRLSNLSIDFDDSDNRFIVTTYISDGCQYISESGGSINEALDNLSKHISEYITNYKDVPKYSK